MSNLQKGITVNNVRWLRNSEKKLKYSFYNTDAFMKFTDSFYIMISLSDYDVDARQVGFSEPPFLDKHFCK